MSGNPVQEVGAILEVAPAGDYVRFAVAAPGVAKGFRPGHFAAVAVGGPQTSMLLRRAFAIYRADPDGTVQFVVAEHGPGTRWLVRRRPGETVDLVGPLGTPFPLPAEPVPAVVVGGGYGSAPLIPLARQLVDAGSQVELILGAASASRLFAADEAAEIGPTTVTTDDGSTGLRGLVTDALAGAITRVGARAVYACGPMPMLRAVGEIAAAYGVTAQVAVEEAMACGIGVCMTCVLPVRADDGSSRFVRSCVDGPVFPADRVRFADVGTLPDDLVGAGSMRER